MREVLYHLLRKNAAAVGPDFEVDESGRSPWFTKQLYAAQNPGQGSVTAPQLTTPTRSVVGAGSATAAPVDQPDPDFQVDESGRSPWFKRQLYSKQNPGAK